MQARTVLGILLVVVAAVPAGAQFNQYTEPGSVPIQDLPTREVLDEAMAEARWKLGPLRVAPTISLSRLGWVEGRGDEPSDLTATLGGGLHAYSRLGSDTVFVAHALPEYTWWRELDYRRVVNGRYGLGAFGFYNRLRFQLLASTERMPGYVSSEFEQLVNISRDRLHGGLELALSGRLALFASAEGLSYAYREEDVAFGGVGSRLLLLERSESRGRGGLRYRLSSRTSIGVGVETLETDFDRLERDRSSSGDSLLVEIDISRSRLTGHAVVLLPDLEPEPGSEFVPYDDVLGTFELGWKPRAKLHWRLYGYRNLVYSLVDRIPYYTNQRAGLSLGTPIGWRGEVSAFVESGMDDYVAVPLVGTDPDRDVLTYGAGLDLRIKKSMLFGVRASRTDYTSVTGFESSTTRIETSLVFGSRTGQWY